ncbi:MAG: beta-ketoacyl synthase chain length factor [Spirochaetales bacterium]|nr:beta-ketoacyl synthase chain length factor [Spirochaetales bacterium]
MKLHLEDHCAWAPSLETEEQWEQWASGSCEIECSTVVPPLEHMSKISKRRLSQLTKMVLQTGHDLIVKNRPDHVIFCSNYGEIRQQYKITRGLLDSGEIRPANFSHSVFNTPLSLLTIEEKVRESVNVLLAGDRCLSMGLQAALAHGACHPKDRQLLIFADELLPEDYSGLLGKTPPPYAFALMLGPEGTGKAVLDMKEGALERGDRSTHPLDFYSWLIKNEEERFTVEAKGSIPYVLNRSSL